jgi:hypothetical protein
MSAIATPKYPQAQPWLDDLTRAAAKVIRGVTAGPLDELDEGICDMDYVLSVRPSQLNTDLRENVRAMNLGELFRSLIGLQDRMVELKVSPDDVRNFAAGGRDLGRLNRELNDLMNQHNSWQDIDNRMRQVEVSLTTGDRMLTFSWKSLSEQLRAQLDAVDPMYVEDLKGSLDDLTAKVSGGTREEKEDAFFSLRSVTQRWFYALDQTLLDRCGELIPIEAALNAILPVVMESNP